MQIKITLTGEGGELDSRKITMRDDDDPAEVSQEIWSTLDDTGWTLAPGDTITITQA